MIYGTIFKAEVSFGEIALGECEVTTGLDGTMTVKFNKGSHTMEELLNPIVTVNGESEERQLQAYRVDNQGNVEISFLTNFVQPTVEENEVQDEE